MIPSEAKISNAQSGITLQNHTFFMETFAIVHSPEQYNHPKIPNDKYDA